MRSVQVGGFVGFGLTCWTGFWIALAVIIAAEHRTRSIQVKIPISLIGRAYSPIGVRPSTSCIIRSPATQAKRVRLSIISSDDT